MAIVRKPKSQTDTEANGVNVEALIAKGGSVAVPQGGTAAAPVESEDESLKVVQFTLRMPGEMEKALADHLKKQRVKVPRHQWVLEAVAERLERDVK